MSRSLTVVGLIGMHALVTGLAILLLLRCGPTPNDDGGVGAGHDSGASDSGVRDAGSRDAGVDGGRDGGVDGGPDGMDAGLPSDAGPFDAGAPDGGAPDAGPHVPVGDVCSDPLSMAWSCDVSPATGTVSSISNRAVDTGSATDSYTRPGARPGVPERFYDFTIPPYPAVTPVSFFGQAFNSTNPAMSFELRMMLLDGCSGAERWHYHGSSSVHFISAADLPEGRYLLVFEAPPGNYIFEISASRDYFMSWPPVCM